MLVIENDWRLSKKVNAGVGGKVPSVHRVSRSDTGSGGKSWVVYITSPVRIASVTSAGAAFACGDNALHMINVDDGNLVRICFIYCAGYLFTIRRLDGVLKIFTFLIEYIKNIILVICKEI